MASQNYPESVRRVFLSEGGYTNDPQDPGGPTNWGITLVDARLHWKPNATAEDVRTMPRSAAEAIYRAKYWAALNCDKLPAGVDYTVFDYGVNSGIGRAGKVLRRVLGLSSNDWRVTEEVLAALAKKNPTLVSDAINDERLHFLHQLKTWPHFGAGWSKRVASVKAFSRHLAEQAPVASPAPAPFVPAEEGKAYAKDEEPVEATEVPNAPAPLPMSTSKIGVAQVVGGGAAVASTGGGIASAISTASDTALQVNSITETVHTVAQTPPEGFWGTVGHVLGHPVFIGCAGLVTLAACALTWFWRRQHRQKGV